MKKIKQKMLTLSLCLALVSLLAILGTSTTVLATAELSLSPATKTVNIGDNFNVDILVNTGGQNVNAVGAYLNYDPTKLEVIGIDTSNSVFTMTAEKTADPTTRMIKLATSKPTPGVNTASGNVATVNFKALAQASPAYVSFVTDSDMLDTCVLLDDGKGTDILSSVKNGAYFIGGGAQPPTVSFTYVPDDYPTIQAAVNVASAGDTIIVRDGTYNENVKVNKRLTVQSENGVNCAIVQAANSTDHVFEVTADYVTIRGFTLQNSNGAGIKINSCNNTITNNNCSYNNNGIRLSGSSNNFIANNIASNNRGEGVLVEDWGDGSCNNTLLNNVACHNSYAGIFLMASPESLTSHNKLLNNTANYNGNRGIELQRSPYNMLSNNKANSNYYAGIRVYGEKEKDYQNSIDTSNTVNGKPVYYFYDIHDQTISGLDTPHLTVASGTNLIIENNKIDGGAGIHLAFVSDSTVTNNIISNNRWGITLVSSCNNKIGNNRLLSNSNDGICCFESSSNNLIVNNTLSHSDISIYRNSNNNIIRNNSISNNWLNGIGLFSSNNNIIYLNNFVDNSRNVHSESSTNLWNSPSKITYTYNGNTYTSHLGNYWDDYIGSDANDDGIGDSAYNIESDKDNYPLITPWQEHIGVPATRTNAELFLSPSTKTVNVGDTFSVDILVNTDGQNVNAVGAYLNYDPTKLEVIGIDTSNSVFTMPADCGSNYRHDKTRY